MNRSSMLYDSPPLTVNPELATLIGLNEAIVLQQLHYWLKKTNHEHDGRTYVYNTLAEWQAQFPFWSEDTLQRVMRSLVRQDLVVVHQFNKQNWDRTNWYAIKYETFESLVPEMERITEACNSKRTEIIARRRRRNTASMTA